MATRRTASAANGADAVPLASASKQARIFATDTPGSVGASGPSGAVVCRRWWWSCGYRGRRSLVGDDGATVHVRSFSPIGDVVVKSWGLISVFGRAGFEIRPPAGDHREGRRDTNSGNFRAKRPLGATPRCLAVVHGALDGLVPGCSTKDPSELMAWCASVVGGRRARARFQVDCCLVEEGGWRRTRMADDLAVR